MEEAGFENMDSSPSVAFEDGYQTAKKDLLRWLRSREGVSYVATIKDVEEAFNALSQ